MPVVTFTTDFGTADGYAGAIKGVVHALAPHAQLVDITHQVPARDVLAGALALAAAAPFFPPGSIHLAVVDPGVGGSRAGLVVEAGGHRFVGPDNGLLSLAARPPRKAWRIESPAFRREPVSPTFHGRDVFAPTAARLAAGHAPAQAGPALPAIAQLELPARGPLTGDGGEGEVVHVDAFGNLVTSFAGAPAPAVGTWQLEVLGAGERAAPRAFTVTTGRTFSDVPPGALVLYQGSRGPLEIAVRDGSAAAATGAGRGTLLRLRGRR